MRQLCSADLRWGARTRALILRRHKLGTKAQHCDAEAWRALTPNERRVASALADIIDETDGPRLTDPMFELWLKQRGLTLTGGDDEDELG
jgi:hypothetical protein